MRLFNFQGSHFDVGRAIGETFREQIRRTLASNVALQETFLPFNRTEEGKTRYEKLLGLHRSFFPDYISELQGMSEGASLSFAELFIANLEIEYEHYAAKPEDSGCSTCSVLTDDAAIIGHNEDNLPIYNEQMYLVKLKVTGKPSLTALSYPGFLPGRAFGFNSKRICFSADSIRPKRVVTGLGRNFISRSLFEAESLQEAIRRATVLGRASGFNYTIGSLKERRIIDVEVSPDNQNVFEIEGCFFHANHLIKLSQVDQSISTSSHSRQMRGEALLREAVPQDESDILRVLRDREMKDYPILRNGKPPDRGMTIVTAIFNLDSGRFTIYPGSAEGKNQTFEPLFQIDMTQ